MNQRGAWAVWLCLAAALSSCTEETRPSVEPLLVGIWEGTAQFDGASWQPISHPICLALYEDGSASLESRKADWALSDLARLSIKIVVPRRYESESFELLVHQIDPAWGTMLYKNRKLKFEQRKRGGFVGVAEGAVFKAKEKLKEENDRRKRETFAETLKRKFLPWRYKEKLKAPSQGENPSPCL